jgi:Na+/H+ antiporter NhaD/arsenite permease-like protein
VPSADQEADEKRPVPVWLVVAHCAFIAWIVFVSHHASVVVLSFLFYIAFVQATERHQDMVRLRSPLLVGFFLGALVIHGGLQAWWIQPVLSSLSEWPLFFGATVLTAFNDNAAITYLASLVPGFTEPMKYAVVAGAVTGGGLTVIANAPNPAGQSILQLHFGPNGVNPGKLFLAALVPTIIMGAAFMLLP